MKRSKFKLYAGRFVEFPGAFIALLIYAGFCAFGRTKVPVESNFKNSLLNAIPTISLIFWMIAVVLSIIVFVR